MKKNTMMRFASVLLVAVLLTTCVISGTFAKYITDGSYEDSARVAKWGVAVNVDTRTDADTFFGTMYNDAAVTEEAAAAVVGAEAVVAPGTNGSVEFSITGTPEVDVAITFEGEATADVLVPADTVDGFDEDYTPVVFTVTKDGSPLATGTLATVISALSADVNKTRVNAGTTLDTTYVLSWAWDFDDNGAGTNDVLDTLLGNVAAGTVTNAAVKTTIDFDFTITVTQIDKQN